MLRGHTRVKSTLRIFFVLSAIFGQTLGSELAAKEARIPHRNIFGPDISDEECKSRDKTLELQDILDGHNLPYAFNGPSQNCTGLGCNHGYWGRRCRFEEGFQPACTYGDRQKMVSWLAGLSRGGAAWAQSILEFKPCDLWPQIRGRTVWVVGDSISQDMTYGLACFMLEYFSLEGQEISSNPSTMRTLTTSANGQEMITWCFNLTQSTRICSLRANKVPRMAETILRLLPSIAAAEDIVMFNLGAWYNYMPEDGMEGMKKDMIQLETALSALRSALPQRIIWRESAAQHFDTASGMFDFSMKISEQRCSPAGSRLNITLEIDNNKALRKAHTSAAPSNWEELEVMLAGGHRNLVTQPVIDRLGLATLPMWNISLMVHDVHKNYHAPDSGGECVEVHCDCSHACSPSWYQMILQDLNGLLLQNTYSERPVAVQKRQI